MNVGDKVRILKKAFGVEVGDVLEITHITDKFIIAKGKGLYPFHLQFTEVGILWEPWTPLMPGRGYSVANDTCPVLPTNMSTIDPNFVVPDHMNPSVKVQDTSFKGSDSLPIDLDYDDYQNPYNIK